MAPDNKDLEKARQHLHEGDASKALDLSKELAPGAENPGDAINLLFAQATCHAILQETETALELLAAIKKIVQGDAHDLSLSVRAGLSEAEKLALWEAELLEATIYANSGQRDTGCELFASMKQNYSELLAAKQEYADILDSRTACALVEAHRYEEAIPIFQALLARPEVEGKQRLQLSFGIALRCTGQTSEALSAFSAAVVGNDAEAERVAWQYLAEYETDQ